MNDINLLEPLYQLLEQVNLLLGFAHAEKWDEFQVNLSAYQTQLAVLEDSRYLNAVKSSGLSAEAQRLVAQLQDLNHQLDGLAEQTHAKIASELRLMTQSTKALDAYSR
jgi:hypothetical protein